jgi:ABC-type glutathione transport system ATPase component
MSLSAWEQRALHSIENSLAGWLDDGSLVCSALDPELTSEVLDVIRRLAEDGTTMIVATHEIGSACEVADTLAFLDHGVIIEHGHPRQLLTRPQHKRTLVARRAPACSGTGCSHRTSRPGTPSPWNGPGCAGA